MVIFQSLNNVVLRLFSGEVFRNKGFQPLGLEADFLFLVGLLLAHDGEDDIGVEPDCYFCSTKTQNSFLRFGRRVSFGLAP